MTPNPLQAREEDRFERPVPEAAPAAEGRGGILKWTIAAVAVVAFAGSVWYAYMRGAQDAADTLPPPLIKADPRPTKVRPDDPGGLQVPNRDKLVYQRLTSEQPDKRVERLLPPPETPVEKPRSAAEEESAAPIAVGATTVVPPRTTAPAKPAPDRSTTLKLTLDPATGEARLPAEEAPPSPASPPSGKAPTPIAPSGTVASVAPAATPSSQAASTRAKAEYGVQLAALKDEAGVPNEWLRLQAAFGSILGKLKSHVMRADLGKRGVFYRLVAGSFADEAGARAACEELQALKQDCLVVKLD